MFFLHVPLQFDLFAAILLSGVVQGLFLFVLCVTKPRVQPCHYWLLAALALCFALLTADIFLSYTGLMARTLALVDATEPINFLVGPLTYLLLRSLQGLPLTRRQALHGLPALLYGAYHLLLMQQDPELKLAAYLHAYHPELPLPLLPPGADPDPWRLQQHLTLLTATHISLYLFLSFRLAYRHRREGPKNAYFFTWVKWLLTGYTLSLLLYLVLRLSFKRDLGDHLLACFFTLQLFGISYKMLTGSAFFQPVIRVKYERSNLNPETRQELRRKLAAAEATKFYRQPSASLPGLARQLGTTPHFLSQVLNEELGQSFFEYLAQLRIAEARQLLRDPALQHLTIEEVAERTGYFSKSAFSAAFKKITGVTPGAFRKQAV